MNSHDILQIILFCSTWYYAGLTGDIHEIIESGYHDTDTIIEQETEREDDDNDDAGEAEENLNIVPRDMLINCTDDAIMLNNLLTQDNSCLSSQFLPLACIRCC